MTVLFAITAAPLVNRMLYGPSGVTYGNNRFDNLERQGTLGNYKGSDVYTPPTNNGTGQGGANEENRISSETNGATRAFRYSSSWESKSLKDAVNKVAPNSRPIVTDSGKLIYNNPKTGKQVVYDIEGNYFRIENTNLHGKRVYTDANGNAIPNNKVVNGVQIGIPQGEYNSITHFNNIDVDFPYDK